MSETTANGTAEHLDEKHSDQYDRQIRIWGVETQKRMMNSKVLVVGFGGLGAEVVKNLVLAGLSATIVDEAQVVPGDLAGNFFLDESEVGTAQRVTAGLPRVQELNQFAKVEGRAESIDAVSDDFIQEHTLIVITQGTSLQHQRLSALAREKHIAFYAADCFGYEGVFFVDLCEHTFQAEIGQGEKFRLADPETMTFPSLSEALAVRWSSVKSKLRPVSPTFMRHQFLLQFRSRSEGARYPRAGSAEDEAQLLVIARDMFSQQGYAADQPPFAFGEDEARTLAATCQAELSPICAVLAGILGQEVIKFLSYRGEPVQNIFVFDANTGEGKAFRLPELSKSEMSKKRKKPPADDADVCAEVL